ncbi:MAG: DUF1353 domain-containing protein [Prochloraceae cyanobacterium]|nr:DUF1353 domain-containing protein [Prochloraceae cyanobacterium]
MLFYTPKKGTLINDGKPIYLATTGKKLFKLSEWWQYKNESNVLFVIPRSFTSDLASIPPIVFWWQYGSWNIAAIAHDWAYIFGYLLIVKDDKLTQLTVSKQEADCIFADINYSLGVPDWVNFLMFLAVRWFGRGIWTSDDFPKYGKSLDELQTEFDLLELS